MSENQVLTDEEFVEGQRAMKERALLALARLPRHQAERAELEGEEWSAALEWLRRDAGTGFLKALLGTRGCGKTQLAVALAQEELRRERPVLYTRAAQIFLKIKATYRKASEMSEEDVVEFYCKPKLLIVDEVQERAETDWEDRLLTLIVDLRYSDRRDTLLIGNCAPAKFEESMGPSVVSRLNETGGIKECKWASFRK